MEDLIQAAKDGDKSAYEKIMRRFQDRVFAIALAQLGNYHQAEDAVQEAFVEAYLRLGQLQSAAAFPGWLHKIVLGKCVRAVRSGKSVTAPVSLASLADVASPVAEPHVAMQEKIVRQTLQNAIARLSEQEREAFVLFAVGGYSYAEIGRLMEIPLSLVKKRIYTARRRLREGKEIASLRPTHRDPKFETRLRERMEEHERSRKEESMPRNTAGSHAVELAGPGDEIKTAVKNLYVFYRYELLMVNHYEAALTPPSAPTDETWRSGAWPNAFGVIDGLHSQTHGEGVAGEDIFWQWPNLQAYLIRVNGWPAGFAFIASPPNATRGVDYRLQEFFVINKARRIGVGSAAARLLFDKLPGRWELAYEPSNPAAAAFWAKFIDEYTAGDFTEEMIGMGESADLPGYVFTKGLRPQRPITVR